MTSCTFLSSLVDVLFQLILTIIYNDYHTSTYTYIHIPTSGNRMDAAIYRAISALNTSFDSGKVSFPVLDWSGIIMNVTEIVLFLKQGRYFVYFFNDSTVRSDIYKLY